MKKIVLFSFLIITSLCFSQNYQLFNSESKKLFATYPEISNTYSLSFDSVKQFGNDSVYYNFYKIEDENFISYDCDFWLGPECFKQNIPVWFGKKADFDNQYSYNFYPNNGDTIEFIIEPILGNSNIFYKDSVQIFKSIYEGADTLSVLNYTDSVRTFQIQHTDLNGNVINSQLNGQSIIIGKNLGLIQFFQIDLFPQLLNPIYLIGDLQNNLGIVKITKGMLYDYQPGDEFQYKQTSFSYNGPPWENYVRYRKHTILNRTETNDSLIYEINETVFYEDSFNVTTNTITKIYLKNQIFIQLPFEVFDGSYKQFYLEEYCDFNFWTYTIEPDYDLTYCEEDNVWGYYDYGGPPPDEEHTFVVGLGTYSSSSSTVYSGGSGQIIYFKKDGIVCGNLVVGTNPLTQNDEEMEVYPNPVYDFLNIRNTKTDIHYDFLLHNLCGQLVKEDKNIQSSNFSLNVADLKAGVYFYVIREKCEVLQQGKLIKR